MTEFNPPISQRETEELIIMAHGSTEDWQEEGIEQAKQELIRRRVSREYQETVIAHHKKLAQDIELAYQRKLELNAFESYSIPMMVYVFFAAPFALFGKWTVGLTLFELKEENYRRKFKQRLILLVGGMFFWIFILANLVNEEEKQRQEEIEQADISEWEKNYYGKDSLNK